MVALNTAQQNLVLLVNYMDRGKGDGPILDILDEKLGIAARALSKIKTGKTQSPHRTTERAIYDFLLSKVTLPWSGEAEAECQFYASRVRDEKWDVYGSGAYSVEKLVSLLRQTTSEHTPSSCDEDEWSALIVSYAYLTWVCFNPEFKYRLSDDRLETYQFITSQLVNLLDKHYPDDYWSQFLRFKVIANRFTVKWNMTPPNERTSMGTRSYFDRLGYLPALLVYLDVCPYDRNAVHNAIMYASRMCMAEFFSELKTRMHGAWSGNPPDLTASDDPDFDEDFDTYRDWLREQNAKTEDDADDDDKKED